MRNSIIAADIGGTSARFGLFSLDGDSPPELCKSVWLKTRDASSFGELIENLRRSEFDTDVSEASFVSLAVAGPIQNGVRCTPPNIDWDIDLSSARDEFGIGAFRLVNDFLAQAYAVLSPIGAQARQHHFEQ